MCRQSCVTDTVVCTVSVSVSDYQHWTCKYDRACGMPRVHVWQRDAVEARITKS